MSRTARRRRLRALGVASSVVLVAALAFVASVAGRAPKAAANPTGASPSVYVVGGEVRSTGPLGTVDAFSLPAVRGDTATTSPIQHATSGGGRPIIGVAVTPNAARAVLLEVDISDGEMIDWTVQVLNIATGSLSSPGPIIGNGPVALAIASDPLNSSVAYAADKGGQIWSVGVSNPPTIKKIGSPGPDGAQGGTETLAIAPNGLTAFLGGSISLPNGSNDDFIDAVALRPGGQNGRWVQPANGITEANVGGSLQELIGVTDLAVAPGGTRIYGSDVGTMFGVGLPLPSGGTAFSRTITSSTGAVRPTTITVSPDGGVVYAAGFTQAVGAIAAVPALSKSTGSLSATPLPVLAGGALRDAAMSIAVSPDRKTLLATIGGGGFSTNAALFPVALGSGTSMTAPTRPITLTNAGGGPQSDASLGPTPGPQAVVVTPDQAPVANFSSVPTVQVGHPVTFDASSSTVAYGSVSKFAWQFGDGTSGSGLAVGHTYTAAGTYTVTLTETDSVGTSVSPAPGTPSAAHPAGFQTDGPGQTPYRHAAASARRTATVRVTATPPTAPTAPTLPTAPTVPTSPTSPTTPTFPTTPISTFTPPGRPGPGVPTLTLNPAVGPPGTIVTVSGTGFQANAPVVVTWSTSTGSVLVVADARGNLPPTQLDILTPDVLGPRFAIASSSPPASAPFLVVPNESEPGGSTGSFLFRSEGP